MAIFCQMVLMSGAVLFAFSLVQLERPDILLVTAVSFTALVVVTRVLSWLLPLLLPLLRLAVMLGAIVFSLQFPMRSDPYLLFVLSAVFLVWWGVVCASGKPT
jgi:hypothetical protein